MRLGPIEVVADRSGALFVPHERTLVVADLHLEKGSAFAARGFLLPPYDTRETLLRLHGVIGRYRPARVVALGDSLHDRGAEARLGAADLDTIHRLQATPRSPLRQVAGSAQRSRLPASRYATSQ
jgi:metallophosphoesterase superfamily enzyme